ncbi:MAG: hypothetical protein K2R98_21860 [Gemmataceae bacterium]|nr:hypothetical protein [Gemmataceae bacterium]
MSSSFPTLPPAWTEMLDGVARALVQTEAEVARTEHALPPSAPVAETTEFPHPDPLAERLHRLQDCVAQAEQTAAQAEAALQLCEEGLKHWLTQAEAIRGKLAKHAADAIS